MYKLSNTGIRQSSAVKLPVHSPTRQVKSQNLSRREPNTVHIASPSRQSINSCLSLKQYGANEQYQYISNDELQKVLLRRLYEAQSGNNNKDNTNEEIIMGLDQLRQLCQIQTQSDPATLIKEICKKIQEYQLKIMQFKQQLVDAQNLRELSQQTLREQQQKIEELLSQNNIQQQQYLVLCQNMSQLDVNSQFQKHQQQSYINKVEYKEYQQIRDEFYNFQRENKQLKEMLKDYQNLKLQFVDLQKKHAQECDLTKSLLENINERAYIDSLIRKNHENSLAITQYQLEKENLQEYIRKQQLLFDEQIQKNINQLELINVQKKQLQNINKK